MTKSAFLIPCTLLLSASFLIQCKPEVTAFEVNESIWAIQECHENDDNAYSSLLEDIIGTWKWQYTSCPSSSDPTVIGNFSKDNTRVIFREDGSVTYQTDSTTVNTTYAFVLTQGNVTPNIQFGESFGLWGNFYMCKDEIAFINSPVDGCDQLLLK